MTNDKLRELAIALFDKNNDINNKAWDILFSALEDGGSGKNQDILSAVAISKGRLFLPANWNKQEN